MIAALTCTNVQRQRILTTWSSINHFPIDDIPLSGSSEDPTTRICQRAYPIQPVCHLYHVWPFFHPSIHNSTLCGNRAHAHPPYDKTKNPRLGISYPIICITIQKLSGIAHVKPRSTPVCIFIEFVFVSRCLAIKLGISDGWKIKIRLAATAVWLTFLAQMGWRVCS